MYLSASNQGVPTGDANIKSVRIRSHTSKRLKTAISGMPDANFFGELKGSPVLFQKGSNKPIPKLSTDFCGWVLEFKAKLPLTIKEGSEPENLTRFRKFHARDFAVILHADENAIRHFVRRLSARTKSILNLVICFARLGKDGQLCR